MARARPSREGAALDRVEVDEEGRAERRDDRGRQEDDDAQGDQPVDEVLPAVAVQRRPGRSAARAPRSARRRRRSRRCCSAAGWPGRRRSRRGSAGRSPRRAPRRSRSRGRARRGCRRRGRRWRGRATRRRAARRRSRVGSAGAPASGSAIGRPRQRASRRRRRMTAHEPDRRRRARRGMPAIRVPAVSHPACRMTFTNRTSPSGAAVRAAQLGPHRDVAVRDRLDRDAWRCSSNPARS